MTIHFVKDKLPLQDCTEMNFLGCPSYVLQNSPEDGECGVFLFEDNSLYLPFLGSSFGISDQTHTGYASLFVLPRHVLIARGLCNTLIPGMSFKTPEPIKRVLVIGEQIVCITKHVIYFLPTHFAITDYVDVDSAEELYVLKEGKVEVYSTKKEVFDVESALHIRCTASPRVVILTTTSDVFRVDLARGTSQHIISLVGHVSYVVYNNILPENDVCTEKERISSMPEVCADIADTDVLLEALASKEGKKGMESLYILHGMRLTRVYLSTLQVRSLLLPYKFRMKVSADYVVLMRLRTFVFLSKDLKRFESRQLEFRGFDCRNDVLAFIKDDLVIVNKARYTFRIGNEWEFVDRFFKTGGYAALRSMYARVDYEDEWIRENTACVSSFLNGEDDGLSPPQKLVVDMQKADTQTGTGRDINDYAKELMETTYGGTAAKRHSWKSRPKKPTKIVEGLIKDLDVLEKQYMEMEFVLDDTEGKGQAEKSAEAIEVGEPELLAMLKRDCEDLYVEKKDLVEKDKETMVIRKYSTINKRKGGF